MALRQVGDVLAAKYRIEALLGTGGMGDVYRATNMHVNREVAIKLLHLKHAADASLLERFLREARVANVVRHPNVVDVLDIDKDVDGSPFIVQELLYGEDLATYVRAHGRLTLDEIRTLIVPIIEAVAEAHAQGVIHRDIKPANIFLANQHVTLESPPSSGRRAPSSGVRVVPKLLDFGISKLRSADTRATDVGVLLGTPAYMAPEILKGVRDADARTDVWALGVMLFELLAGRRPFVGAGASIFIVIATTDAPPLAQVAPDVARDVAEVVDRCLRRDVTERFASAAELATALSAALPAASARVPTVSVEPMAMAPLETSVPDLDLPRTLGGGDPTTVDPPPPSSIAATLPSRVASTPPERTDWTPPLPPVPSLPQDVARPSVSPVRMTPSRAPGATQPRRSGSGLMLEETPRTSLRPPTDRRESLPVVERQADRRAQSVEFPWLTSLLVLGITALAACGGLMAATGHPGFAIVRPFVETSTQTTMAVQVGAALAVGAIGALTFRGGMRQWQVGASLTALTYAGASGALLFAALELLRAA